MNAPTNQNGIPKRFCPPEPSSHARSAQAGLAWPDVLQLLARMRRRRLRPDRICLSRATRPGSSGPGARPPEVPRAQVWVACAWGAQVGFEGFFLSPGHVFRWANGGSCISRFVEPIEPPKVAIETPPVHRSFWRGNPGDEVTCEPHNILFGCGSCFVFALFLFQRNTKRKTHPFVGVI